MQTPYILKSNYQFVILGSVRANYGLILKSHTCSLKVVGLAQKIHSEGYESISKELHKILKEDNIRFMWSEPYPFVGIRQSKILLVVKSGVTQNPEITNKSLKTAFEGFIVNSSFYLRQVQDRKVVSMQMRAYGESQMEYWFSGLLIDLIHNKQII